MENLGAIFAIIILLAIFFVLIVMPLIGLKNHDNTNPTPFVEICKFILVVIVIFSIINALTS